MEYVYKYTVRIGAVTGRWHFAQRRRAEIWKNGKEKGKIKTDFDFTEMKNFYTMLRKADYMAEKYQNITGKAHKSRKTVCKDIFGTLAGKNEW